jgi:YidC/Oxa1 family membrane protein insertase
MSTTMDKTQRTMMMILPVAFVPVIINFPVGLVIYWVTTNLWTVGQGLVTRQMMPKAKPPPKRSSRTPPKSETQSQDGAAEPAEDKPAAPPAPPRRVKRKKRKARR